MLITKRKPATVGEILVEELVERRHAAVSRADSRSLISAIYRKSFFPLESA